MQTNAIKIENGIITSVDREHVGPERLLPGFIDIHIHGAAGVDVNTANASELLRVAEFLATNGVTAWVPTLVPDSDDAYARAIDAINELMRIQEGKPVAQALGVHYEGVFASEHMCGALRPEFFKVGGRQLAVGGQMPKLERGIHMTTLAPEVVGGIELIEELVGQGWIVSIGHTRANAETLDRAFEAGARHMTHFFNAMTGVHHRDLGVAGWGLAKKDVTFDIIADGIHVRDEMLGLACRAKGADKVSLISDSVAPTGLADGEFELWGKQISVTDGRTRNERGSIAGSVITMHDAVKRMLSLGFTHDDVSKMASTNPSKLLGVDGERGSLDKGKRADFVVLDESWAIMEVSIGGEPVAK